MTPKVKKTGARRPQTPREGRQWRQDPQGRRELVLAAAEAEIREKRLDGLRTGAVAKRAGVAEGTVFSLFGSKSDLLAEIGHRYAEGMVKAAFGNILENPNTPDVDAFVDAVFDYAASDRELLEAFFWMTDSPQARALDAAVRSRVIDAIEAGIIERAAGTRLPYKDTRVAASIQFGMVENALRDCFLRTGGEQETAYRREVATSLKALLDLEQS